MSESIYISKICQECNSVYNGSGKKFCSLRCQNINKGRIEAQEADERYLRNPKLCLRCQTVIPRKKAVNEKALFCSMSCRTSHCNTKRQKKITICTSCAKPFSRRTTKQKFCSISCANQQSTETLNRFHMGLIRQRQTLRPLLIRRDGNSCSVCKITDWQSQPITFQVDHIDGNPGNHLPANLRLICPNCHRQTPSFGGRNKGNGRKARGLPR